MTVAATVAVLSAAPALAQDHGGGSSEGSGVDVVPGLVWSSAAVGVSAVVLGALYLFKKQIGGFPDHPEWTAPIEIMPSSGFPDEGTYGDGDGHDAHGHGSHH